MPDLFVRPPLVEPEEFLPADEAAKTADIRLTSAPSGWADEIVQHTLRDHPYLPAERLIVNFQRRDDPSGYAVGYIAIQGAPRLSLPIIVSQRKLKPIDILIRRHDDTGEKEEDDIEPLTENAVMEALDDNVIGDPVQQNDPNQHMTRWTEDGSALHLPFRGRTVVASVMGASQEQKLAFAKVLDENRDVVAGFALHSQSVADAWLNAPEPQRLVQTKLASAPVELAEAHVLLGLPEEIATADRLAARVVVGSGNTKVATVFQTVNLANPLDTRPFMLFDDGTYCMAPEKVAALSDESEVDALTRQVLTKTAAHGVQVGDVITILLDTVFSEPAKIASIQIDDAADTLQLDLVSMNGAKYPVILSSRIAQAVFEPKTASWMLPVTNQVLKLGHYADEHQRPMPIDKVAHHFESIVPDRLICSGGLYTLNAGNGALQIDQLEETKTSERLQQWFTNGDVLLTMAKEAARSNGGTGVIRFASNLAEVQTKVAASLEYFEGYPEAVKDAVVDVALPLEKAAKLAAALSLPEGADAVLGLGFLNENNISELMGMVDTFRDTVSKLARLLLFIRMGLPEGDEAATMVAMHALQRVADKLEAIMAGVMTD